MYHKNIGNRSDTSGKSVPLFENLCNKKKIPHVIKVKNIEREVNLPILKNLLFKEEYAKIIIINGNIKKIL